MKITKKETKALVFENVEIREALVEDLINAERMGNGDMGIDFALCVLSQIATFDEKKLVPEELRRLKAADFLALARGMEEIGLEELAEQFSSSQKRGESPSVK